MRKSIIAAIAVVAVLILILYIALRSPTSDFLPGADNGISIVDNDVSRFPSGGFDARALLTSYDPEIQLERYVQYARYPDFSRPLTRGHGDLLDSL